jgi:ATP-binding protein involved in chromosome partitioning
MAERTNLRPIGVVENMSFYLCPHCGDREDIFGTGGGREAAETLSVPLLAQVPLVPAVREGGDSGVPIVVSHPESPASIALIEAAGRIERSSRSRVGKPLSVIAGPSAPAAAGGDGHAHGNSHGHAPEPAPS